MISKIDGKLEGAPEGTWVSGERIEIPCIYSLCWAKVRKIVYDKNKTIRKRLNIIKNQSIPTT